MSGVAWLVPPGKWKGAHGTGLWLDASLPILSQAWELTYWNSLSFLPFSFAALINELPQLSLARQANNLDDGRKLRWSLGRRVIISSWFVSSTATKMSTCAIHFRTSPYHLFRASLLTYRVYNDASHLQTPSAHLPA